MADAKKSASARDKAVYCWIRNHLVLHVPIVTLNMKYELTIVDVCLLSLPTNCPQRRNERVGSREYLWPPHDGRPPPNFVSKPRLVGINQIVVWKSVCFGASVDMMWCAWSVLMRRAFWVESVLNLLRKFQSVFHIVISWFDLFVIFKMTYEIIYSMFYIDFCETMNHISFSLHNTII